MERWEYGTLYTIYPGPDGNARGLFPRCMFATDGNRRMFPNSGHKVWNELGAEGWIIDAEPDAKRFVPEWLEAAAYGEEKLPNPYGTPAEPVWSKQHARRRVG
ncbi:hypothetical protein [Micromonospora sp. CA-244673]|uniref:hypothetical protein n=1 Tax=Micromonospora sp. CA-244673 TaxID=3239958 RepID=UPI003D901D06